MNTDLNTAVFHSYKLAQQLVSQYTAFGAKTDPLVLYAKEFYEYLTADSPYDFDTLLQSLETVVARTIAEVSAAYCNLNATNNKKILEAAQKMEKGMRSSGMHYSGKAMNIKLTEFNVSCFCASEIVNQAYKELDGYAAFATMALNNDWSEDPNIKLVEVLKDLTSDWKEELAIHKDIEIEHAHKDLMLKNSLSVYSEAYLMDNAIDNDDNLKSAKSEILSYLKKKKL